MAWHWRVLFCVENFDKYVESEHRPFVLFRAAHDITAKSLADLLAQRKAESDTVGIHRQATPKNAVVRKEKCHLFRFNANALVFDLHKQTCCIEPRLHVTKPNPYHDRTFLSKLDRILHEVYHYLNYSLLIRN